MAYNNSCERALYLISTFCWVQFRLFIFSVRVFGRFFILFRAFAHTFDATRRERLPELGKRETIRNEKMAH